MTVGQFYHMLRGRVNLRVGSQAAYLSAVEFMDRYLMQPVWMARIDVIRGEVVGGVCCFTIHTAKEVAA